MLMLLWQSTISSPETTIEVGKNSFLCILKNRDGALGDIRIEGDMQFYEFKGIIKHTTYATETEETIQPRR